MDIKKNLLLMKDEKYLLFHSKLCKDVNLIGIRVPLLKKYAKELYKEIDNVDYWLENIDNEYYEEIMLKGMIISLDKKCSFDTLEKRLNYFVPLIDNWATCDTFCADLKITNEYKDEIYNYIKELLKSHDEFTLRFAIVMFLDYFIEIEYMEEILPMLLKIENDAYYVKMAISWALSICLIKEYDYTIKFIEHNNLSDFIFKTTIQKAIDSYRINDEKKNYLRELRKRKNEKRN